uniref:hypothetical protein n=1 Tax=Flavobacterium sp. TaxID=239 RepID=UPI00404B359C
MNKNLLNNESCPEKWEEMTKIKQERFCSKCKIGLTDLTELTIENIAKNHYGKGKCVGLTNEQIDFIINYRQIKKIVIASSLFIGTTFFNLSYGQTAQNKVDSCLVKGKVVGIENEIVANRPIYIYIKANDSIYETQTDENGDFSIYLPKNAEIKYSNVSKLISKKTKNRSLLNIRKSKLKPRRTNPGFF